MDRVKMHPEIRRQRLLQLITANPMLSVQELADRLRVSLSTIHRDLRRFRLGAPSPAEGPAPVPCDLCGADPCEFNCDARWVDSGLRYVGGAMSDGRIGHSLWRIAAPGWGRIDDHGPLAKGVGATDDEARRALAANLCRVAEVAERAARASSPEPIERRRCLRCDASYLAPAGAPSTCGGCSS